MAVWEHCNTVIRAKDLQEVKDPLAFLIFKPWKLTQIYFINTMSQNQHSHRSDLAPGTWLVASVQDAVGRVRTGFRFCPHHCNNCCPQQRYLSLTFPVKWGQFLTFTSEEVMNVKWMMSFRGNTGASAWHIKANYMSAVTVTHLHCALSGFYLILRSQVLCQAGFTGWQIGHLGYKWRFKDAKSLSSDHSI